MRRLLLSLLILPVLAGCAATARDETPFFDRGPERDRATAAELISARHAMMHMAASLTFGSVMPATGNGSDVRKQQGAAEALAHFGHSIAGLFPDGSAGPHSRAAPAIWTNKADFEARSKAFGDASARLAELAGAGDSAGFAAQAKTVAAGCNSCHTLYRLPAAPGHEH
jgi:cytochrome c556